MPVTNVKPSPDLGGGPDIHKTEWDWFWDNPPVWGVPLNEGAGAPRDSVRNEAASSVGSNMVWKLAADGWASHSDTANSNTYLRWENRALTARPWTLFMAADLSLGVTAVLHQGNPASGSEYSGLQISSTAFIYTHRASGVDPDSTTGTSTPSVGYNSIAGVEDGSTHRLYANGVQENTSSGGLTNVANYTRITLHRVDDSSPSNEAGTIYCSYIFDYALAPSQISQLNIDPFGPFTLPDIDQGITTTMALPEDKLPVTLVVPGTRTFGLAKPSPDLSGGPDNHGPEWDWFWEAAVYATPFNDNGGIPRSYPRNLNASVSGTTWGYGEYGPHLDFDGTDDWINVSADAALDNIWTTGGSAFAFINIDTFGQGSTGKIFDKGEISGNGWVLETTDSGAPGTISLRTEWSTGRSWHAWNNNTMPLNTWMGIGITYNGSSSSNVPVMYRNGLAVTANTYASFSGTISDDSADTIRVGGRSDGFREINGRIAMAALFNRELTAAQHAQLADDPFGPFHAATDMLVMTGPRSTTTLAIPGGRGYGVKPTSGLAVM